MSGRCLGLCCYVRPLLSLYGIIYVTWYTRVLPQATRVRFRGSFRYSRSYDYQIPTRHALLGHRKRTLTSSTIDLSRLPPTKACLREHTARANYQRKIWKTANIPISEVPADQLMDKLKNSTILMMMTMTPT